jgi:septal ring factor EnvC (AmiA/AmiB activator)
LVKIIESKGHTSTSLLEAAISRQQERIQKLDLQIALRVKTLTQLQQSYEALVNRSVMQEWLKLQNELLKRDLQAIEVDAQIKKPRDALDDKPQTKSRK